MAPVNQGACFRIRPDKGVGGGQVLFCEVSSINDLVGCHQGIFFLMEKTSHELATKVFILVVCFAGLTISAVLDRFY